MDRERLAAFVDGALEPEEAAEVVLRLEASPADRAYVDRLMELGSLLGEAYAAPLYEPVPERFLRTVFGAPVAELAAELAPESKQESAAVAPRAEAAPPRRAARTDDPRGGVRPASRRARGLRVAAFGAVAASAAFLVAFGSLRDEDVGALALTGAAEAALAAALETRPSGAVAGPDGASITLIATFLDAEGRPCREFELRDPAAASLTRGLACREDGDWRSEIALSTRIASAAAAGGSEDFVPAEGPAAGAISAALDRIGAGLSLTPAEEQALVASGWSR
jgi:hypothetical protein